MILEAKTKTKLFTASPQKKMMQDGPVLSGWASGQTKEDNHLLFENENRGNGSKSAETPPFLSASRTSLLFDLSQKGLHFGASKSAWQVIATHPPAAALAKDT